jgi:hypothetical protein
MYNYLAYINDHLYIPRKVRNADNIFSVEAYLDLECLRN